jgi:hypothetical protein
MELAFPFTLTKINFDTSRNHAFSDPLRKVFTHGMVQGKFPRIANR